MKQPILPLAAILLMILLVSGCDPDERVTRIATESAERQAAQNQEMARLNREVAEGTKILVEADKEARSETLSMQRDLQEQQTGINSQRDELETERQEIARERRAESVVVPALKACGLAAVVVVTVGFCWYLLFGLQRHDNSDEILCELLIRDAVSDVPTILPQLPISHGLDKKRLPTLQSPQTTDGKETEI